MVRKLILFVLLVIISTPQVYAQSLKIGPQAGYHKSKDVDDGKLMFGAVLRLKLSSALRVEGSINYRQEKFSDDNLTVRSWPIMVTGLIYPFSVVYGAVGAGWYNTTLDFDISGVENVTNQEFGWHFGGGLELPVGSKSALTGDVRYVFLDYSFDELPTNLDSNFYVITVGFLFGL